MRKLLIVSHPAILLFATSQGLTEIVLAINLMMIRRLAPKRRSRGEILAIR